MIEKYSNVAGYTQGVPTTMADIDKIQEADLQKIEEIHQYQPNTRSAFFGQGPEAWHSTSYIRQREMYGAALVGEMEYLKKN